MANVTINPSKFSVYDSDMSDYSDVEIDAEEWVTVTSSTTTSTCSTLPKHLMLQPKTGTGRFGPPQRSSVYTPLHGYKNCSVGDGSQERHVSTRQTTLSAPATLKAHLPHLTAIYIAYPSGLKREGLTAHNSSAKLPFSSFHTPNHPSPLVIHAPFPQEHYIKVCADCAKPRMTLFCDGTWTSTSAGICSIHTHILQKKPSSRLEKQQQPGSSSSSSANKSDTTSSLERRCSHGANEGCTNCDLAKDRELFGVLLEAVQPFRRQETEKWGVKVFDLTVPCNGEVYSHKPGCTCMVNAAAL